MDGCKKECDATTLQSLQVFLKKQAPFLLHKAKGGLLLMVRLNWPAWQHMATVDWMLMMMHSTCRAQT